MGKELILVNEQDEEIGYGEKMSVHINAQLHRAFSMFVMNDQNQLMLQKGHLVDITPEAFGQIPAVAIR